MITQESIGNNQNAVYRLEARNIRGELAPLETLDIVPVEGGDVIGTITRIEDAADGCPRVRVTTNGAVGTAAWDAVGDSDLGPGFKDVRGRLVLTTTDSGQHTLTWVRESVSDRAA